MTPMCDDADAAPSPVRAPTPRKRLSTPVNNPNPTRGSRRQPGNISKGLNNSHGWVALTKATTLGMRVLSPDSDSGSPPAPQVGFAALAKASSADPKTQSEAYASDEEGWRASEKKEVANHESNGSWVLVERSSVPRNRNLIKLIWVYKVKRDGSLKSRLCVQGCRQVPGVDYDQTWSGTMRGASLRLLSAQGFRFNVKLVLNQII